MFKLPNDIKRLAESHDLYPSCRDNNVYYTCTLRNGVGSPIFTSATKSADDTIESIKEYLEQRDIHGS